MGHMKDFDIRIRSGGDDAIAAVSELMPQWIPVSERLPEPDVDVLIHFAIHGLEIGCIESLSWHWLCARDVCRDEATHWMPLPEPPEVK